jgi:DNA-binding beta-propeller fold protein YncE
MSIGGSRLKRLRWPATVVGSGLLLLVIVAAVPTLLRRNGERYDPVLAWGRPGDGPGEFRGPVGVAVDDSGFVYISDSGNDRIQKFTADGRFVAAWGSSGAPLGQLRRPMHLRLGPGGLLYVAEYLNDRIQIFTLAGTPVGQLGIDTVSPPGALDAPGGVAVSPNGREVWIADFYHHRIAVFGRDGRYLRQVGAPGRGSHGKLHYPTDVVFGPDGTAYVADAYNNRVQRFARDGRVLGAWGGPLGSGLPGSWRGWFRVATGITVDSAGDVYVADFYNNRVQKFGPTGAFITEWGASGAGSGEFDRPTAVAVGPNGWVYVADFGNNRVQAFRRARTRLQDNGRLGRRPALATEPH